jgi:imidazolonepropionase-like amidohydrolase
MRILGLLLASLLALAAAPVPAGRTVYRHAALIDGTGAPLRRDVAVVVAGERIVAVVPDGTLTPRQLRGARVVDLSGKYLLPGLIDSHQHIATPPERAKALALPAGEPRQHAQRGADGEAGAGLSARRLSSDQAGGDDG